MNWKHIIEDKYNYISKIHEIACVFENNIKIEKDFLFDGKLGVSLFCFYYGRHFNNDRFINIGYEYIEKSFKTINCEISRYSISSGICGFYWLLKQLEKENFIDKGLFENWDVIEKSLVSRINYEIKINNWDFLHGIMGIAWSIFKFNPMLFKEISLPLLNQFGQQGDNFDDGSIAWQGYRRDHDNSLKEIYSMGLAHGIPGIILILSNFVKYNIETQISNNLLQKSFLFMKKHRLDVKKYGYYFPHYINFQNGTYPAKQRLAWCYGDLGIGFALYKAGVNASINEMKELGLQLLYNCCTKRTYEETLANDAGFCHGTVGIAHIFNRIYQETNIIDFKTTAQYWFERTLQHATFDEGYAGYKSFNGHDWVLNHNLLEGIAGIGLSLMSAISEYEPKWDNCFLLS